MISSTTASSGPLGVLSVSASAASDCSSGCKLYAFPGAAGVTFNSSQIAVDGNDNMLVSANVSSNGAVSIDSGGHYTGLAVVSIAPSAATDCSTGCTLVASTLKPPQCRSAVTGGGRRRKCLGWHIRQCRQSERPGRVAARGCGDAATHRDAVALTIGREAAATDWPAAEMPRCSVRIGSCGLPATQGRCGEDSKHSPGRQ